jgi:hypothetical protein
MEHVLAKCEVLGQAQIWGLAKQLWMMKGVEMEWIEPTFGNILASPSVVCRSQNADSVGEGNTRLYWILMTESAHLIWKIRCERVIRNEEITPTEVHNKWINMMNQRHAMDCRMASKKYEKKAVPKKLLLGTWKGTLLGENRLPADWSGESGVLVGIRPQKNDGRGRDR